MCLASIRNEESGRERVHIEAEKISPGVVLLYSRHRQTAAAVATPGGMTRFHTGFLKLIRGEAYPNSEQYFNRLA